MKILVYGAGVVGCELAHVLLKKKNDVTLLARGDWKRTIDNNGLIINHYIQMHNTVDKIKTIERLDVDDEYDLIFVVMQYGQLKDVIPILAENKSCYIIFIGNNMKSESFKKELLFKSAQNKEIAFGFQGTGGRRENGKVISIHLGLELTIGVIGEQMSEKFSALIKKALKNTKCTYEYDMKSWYISHMAFILPLCFLCYKYNGNLRKSSKEDINNVIDSVIEAHELLKSSGYEIRPDGEEEAFTKHRKRIYIMLYGMLKTVFGKLAVSDHAMHAVDEMRKLDETFEDMRKINKIDMHVWDKLRDEGNLEKYRNSMEIK